MSRRLHNRSAGPATSSTATTTLPEYQPPSCPLNDDARRSLGKLAENRGTGVYKAQIKESIRLFGASVGDLHERLREQRDKLQATQTRRQEKGTDKTADEERLEAHVAELEAKVDTLTDDSEAALRDLIDYVAQLEDENAVLNQLYTDAATAGPSSRSRNSGQRRHRQHDGTDEGEPDENKDDIDLEPAVSTVGLFKDRFSEKETTYASMTMHQRYGQNNDYAAFKKLWHDAMAGEDGPPLPDASRWFRPDGQPVMRAAGLGAGRDGEESDDDDIAVAREVISINCPLTLVPMENPYSNRKCKHTFEKAAILDYLPIRGEAQCPQTGCSSTFSRARFEQDFFPDEAMARRIRRVRQAQEQNDREEAEDDDSDEDLVVRGHKSRGGRVPKREKVEV